MIVHLLVAVEMHRPGEEGARLVLVELLVHQQRIGAEVDEFLAARRCRDDFRQLLVQQRLAAGDRHDRRAALVDGAQCILDGHVLVQDRIRIVDLAAARASQIAPEQRLQHQHQRIALAAGQSLANDVATDKQLLKKRNAQDHYPY